MSRCGDCRAVVDWFDGVFLSGHVGRICLDVAPSEDGRWRIGTLGRAYELTGMAAHQAHADGEDVYVAHRDTCRRVPAKAAA